MKVFIISLFIALACQLSVTSQTNSNMNYSEQWKKVENLLNNERLPETALVEIQKIYSTALQEKEYSHVIKAIIYRMDCQAETSENVANVLIDSLKRDLEIVPQPARSVVYCLLGDVYKNFFNANRWQLIERSHAVIEDDDIYTWDVNKLYEEALKNYKLALQDKELLQQTPLTDYEILIRRSSIDNTKLIYPSLYDFLVKHTITLLEGEMSVAKPQEAFVMNQPEFFADARTFSQYKIETKDTLSTRYQIISLYQELLKYKLEAIEKDVINQMLQKNNQLNGNLYSLINWDLERLRFVHKNGTYANSDALYESALLQMRKDLAEFPEKNYVDYWLAELYKSQGDRWATEKNESFKLKYMQAYEICNQLQQNDSYQEIKYFAQNLQQSITSPSVQFTLDNVQYPNTPILALLNYQNLQKLELVIYKISEKVASERYFYGINDDKLKSKTVFRKQTIELPQTKDYQRYTTEIKIDDLPQGHYIILAKDGADSVNNDNFYSTATIQVTPIVMTMRSHANNSEAQQHITKYNSQFKPKKDHSICQLNVVDSKAGAPLHKAKIDIYTQTWSSLRNDYVERLEESYYTDENGTAFTNNWAYGKENAYFKRAVISQGDKKIHLFSWNDRGYGWNYPSGNYQRCVFFTDRSIYRPGQTVYFKGLLYESDTNNSHKLLTNVSTHVELLDVNRKSIADVTLVSNEYGSIQGSFVIPQGLLNGRMTIRGYNSEIGIQVEEYKRPTFEVKFDPVKQNYKLNSDVEVTASAKALAGYAVDHSMVQYRIVRNVRYRHFGWWFPPVTIPTREIASGQIETDAKGAFTIRFRTEADDVTDNNLIYNYSITADVTDANGETRSAILNLPVSNKPLLIQGNIPERITDSGKLTFPLSTTNLNGDLTPAIVDVIITKLQGPDRILHNRLWAKPDTFIFSKSEFESLFPYDPYGDEKNPMTFKELQKVGTLQLKTTDGSKGQSGDNQINLQLFENCAQGWYKIDLKGRNEEGVEVEETRFVQWMGKAGAKANPIQNVEDWVTVIKKSGEPGEYAEFRVAGGSSDSYIRYELICKDQIIERKTIQVGTTPQTIRIPIQENYRGGFALQFVMVNQGRLYTSMNEVYVPYTNKMLDITFTTFRDKLLPGEEEKWILQIQNKKGEKEMAEMVASLYDASLDHFLPHSWNTNFYPTRSHQSYIWLSGLDKRVASSNYYNYSEYNITPYTMPYIYFYNYGGYTSKLYTHKRYYTRFKSTNMMLASGSVFNDEESAVEMDEVEISALQSAPAPPAPESKQMAGISDNKIELAKKETVPDEQGGIGGAQSEASLEEIGTRQNFNETAFFYPQLRTDESGKIIIEFTIPEALTRWKMLGFAHTKDLKTGAATHELITQKQVAISANAPRFFRENDVIEFSAKVNNITVDDLKGEAMLRVFDAVTMQPIDARVIRSKSNQTFDVKAGESTGLKWTLAIPSDVQAITYKVTARAGSHTDGEEKIIPVMKNSMLVTETMPFSVRGGQEKTFTFHKLKENRSNTLQNHKLTLEFTSNPAWYAVQSLPYLMEYPYECAEQTFARFYANSLASTIVGSSPRIKQIFDLWRNVPENKQALLSNLEKNQELKQVMLEETPWVMQADNETERKKRVGLLFDLNKMSSEQRSAFEKVKKAQQSNGGFGWFNGLPPSRYMTQHIVAKIEHLKKLQALGESYQGEATKMAVKGLGFLDKSIQEDYDELLKIKNIDLSRQYVSCTQLHYLYTTSFTKHKPSNDKQRKAFDYYYGQAEKYWNKFDLYNQALIALAMHRYGNTDKAMQILQSLKERSQRSEEMGMYWKENEAGYYWYQAPIETQALLIEAFLEIANDLEAVEEMKIWLLRMKQTTDWKTTKATSEACYALLMTGGNLLEESKLLEVSIGGKPLSEAIVEEVRSEAGTGYVKTSWNGSDIKQEMGIVEVKNPNQHGIAWGGVYWQYFEQLDKITSGETNLKMNKQLFVQKITEKGAVLEPIGSKDKLKVGDLVKVRMELRADRDYEFVHLKDMRAAGFEPVSTLSGHRSQDGLWYYESIKDASANFFITYLNKGTYVFEYDLRVTHAGDFSNGITTFQCMYAPEFSSHSEGIRVKVEGQ